MVQVLPAVKSFGAEFGSRIGKGLAEGFSKGRQLAEDEEYEKQENEAVKRLIGEDISGIRNPKIREKYVELAKQNMNKSVGFSDKINSNQSIISDLEKRRGLPEGSLNAYVNDPKMAEQVSRPKNETKKTQASQPIDPDQLRRINEVRSQPGFNDLDEVDQYRAMTNAGVSKENAEAEAKLTGQKLERGQKKFEQSYAAQEDFINDTTYSYKGFETEMKPRLLQMQKMASDDDLIGPTSAAFLEHLGIPLGALEDPSSELYNKVSQDLLKGLPETYGNRILKVEVENFLKTIPTLLNSPSGRRMIASNMLKLGELKEIYYKEMRDQQKKHLDESKPLPKDFQQRIFDQVKPQIDRVNEEFVKLSDIKSVPPDTIPFFDPNGNVVFVPKDHAQWAQENGGKRIW